jgi:hypothetical protein
MYNSCLLFLSDFVLQTSISLTCCCCSGAGLRPSRSFNAISGGSGLRLVLHSYYSMVRGSWRISMFELVVLEAMVLARVVVVVLHSARLFGLHPFLGPTPVVRSCMVGGVLALFAIMFFLFFMLIVLAVSVALSTITVLYPVHVPISELSSSSALLYPLAGSNRIFARFDGCGALLLVSAVSFLLVIILVAVVNVIVKVLTQTATFFWFGRWEHGF